MAISHFLFLFETAHSNHDILYIFRRRYLFLHAIQWWGKIEKGFYSFSSYLLHSSWLLHSNRVAVNHFERWLNAIFILVLELQWHNIFYTLPGLCCLSFYWWRKSLFDQKFAMRYCSYMLHQVLIPDQNIWRVELSSVDAGLCHQRHRFFPAFFRDCDRRLCDCVDCYQWRNADNLS